MATRKENFWKYYQANPDKLKGKSVQEAYEAMRRNVASTQGRAAKSNSGANSRAAVERRLAKHRELSMAGKSDDRRVSPLAKGAAAVWNSPKKLGKILPDPGFGSNQKNNTGAHGKAGLPDIKVWKAGETKAEKLKRQREESRSSRGGHRA